MLNAPATNDNSANDNRALPDSTSSNGATENSALENRAASRNSGATARRDVPSPSPHSGDFLDVGGLLSALWRRRRLMLTTFALVLLGGVLLTARQRSVYEATCSILITSPAETSPTATDSLRGLLSGTQPRSVGTQLAIMRSYPMQRATLKRLAPDEQKIAKSYYKLDVRPQRDSDAIDIVAESYDPQVAARLANALSLEYMAQYQQQNRAQVQAATRETAQQLAAAKQRLDEASNALKNYKLANGTVDIDVETKARLGQIDRIEISLRDLQSQRAANVAEIQALKQQIAAMPQVQVIPERIVRRPALESLQNQLTQLELQRIATLRRYREGSPEIRAIDAQRKDIQNRLQTMAQTQVSSWVRSVNPVRQGLTQQIASTQSQVWAIDARVRALQNSAGQARQQQALLPEREYRLNQLKTEQAVLQQTYRILNEKYQALLVSEGAKLTTARPLAPAEAPSSPIRPRRTLNLIMSVLLGGVLAVALALLFGHIDDHLHSVDEAQKVVQLPVLAQVPWIASASGRSLLGDTSDSSLLESFRSLRANLMLAGTSIHNGTETVALPSSLLITGSREGQETSLCALNLAIVTAQSGTPVVLVDCDLRHPVLHSLLNLKSERGLTNVLSGSVGLEEALQETGVAGLRVLTGGLAVDNAAQLLDSNTARQALQNIAARAEFVIFLGAPVLSGADTQIVATISETALLVVSSEAAQGSEMAQARDSLERTGVRLLGLVWNNAKA